MFNVVVARLLGDPEPRRYDTPSASSIGQPRRLPVNVPDLTRFGSDSVRHIEDMAILHLVRFQGMIPASTFRPKRPGTLPDGIPERFATGMAGPLLEGGCVR